METFMCGWKTTRNQRIRIWARFELVVLLAFFDSLLKLHWHWRIDWSVFIIPRPPYRTSNLQKRPSALPKRTSSTSKHEISKKFSFIVGHFCPPGSGYGSTDLIKSGSAALDHSTVTCPKVCALGRDPKNVCWSNLKIKTPAASFIPPFMSTKVETIWWDSPFKLSRCAPWAGTRSTGTCAGAI